jgi:hypothetical protein
MKKTDNKKIFIERDQPTSREDIEAKLDILRDALEKTKSSIASPIIRDAMKKAVPSFVDPEEINKAAEGSDEMKMINSKNPQATE